MLTPADQRKTAHQDLHSERGAEPGDRPDRAANPVIKVEDLAWLEFEKPDLDHPPAGQVRGSWATEIAV